jgi:hypothetical protein
LAATALGGAVEDFLKVLAEMFLPIDTTDKQQILKAYAHEQMSDMILRDETISYRGQPRDMANITGSN